MDVILTMPERKPREAGTVSDGSYNVGMVGTDSSANISSRKVGFKTVEEVVGKPVRRAMNVTLVRQ